MTNPKKKQVFVISRASYRGYTIYETPTCLTVFLGMLWYSSQSLGALTKQIDEYLDLKKN